MTPKNLKVLVMFALVGLVLAAGNGTTNGTTSNLTFAPPPPINMTVAAMLNDSIIGGRLIGSKRIEALQASPNNTGNVSTNIRIASYNRNAPNGVDVLDLTIPGNWTPVAGTQDTLSCSVLHDEVRGGYGLLQYLSEARSLRLLTPDLLARAPGAQNLSVEEVVARLQPMENCDGVYFNGTLLRVIPGSNNVTVVTVPSGWTPRSSPESLQFGVAANTLYRYDPMNATFTSLLTFPPSQAYEVRSSQGRIVVAAANSTNTTNGLTQINQTFFVLNNLASGLKKVGQFNVSGAFNMSLPVIPFMTSPQLTKLGIAVPAPNGNSSAPSNMSGPPPSNNSAPPPSNNSGPSNTTTPNNMSAPSNMSEPIVIIVLKSVDYAASTISPLNFKDPERFRRTVRNLQTKNNDRFLGDNYYVVRNASGGNPNGPNGPNGTNGTNGTNSTLPPQNVSAVEQAYQFVGGDIIFLRDRILNESREFTDYRRTWIDDSFPNQLVVLDGYRVPGGLEINQFTFGSLASVNKVVPPTIPPFLTFPVSPQTVLFAPEDAFSWVLLNTDPTPVTNFTIISADPTAPNNIRMVNASVPGNISILAMSQNCMIFVDTISQNVTVAAAGPPTNGTNGTAPNGGPNGTLPNGSAPNGSAPQNGPFVFENITPLLANFSINGSSRWSISDKCDRFAVDNRLFFRPPGQPHFNPIRNNISDFRPSSFDFELTAAVVNNSIWLLNPNTSSFVRAFDNPEPILPRSNIAKRENRLVVIADNGTAAQVLAFAIEPSGNFTNCLKFFFPMYQAPPKIYVSPQFTKVLVMGPFTPPNASQPQPKFDAFTVDYNKKTSMNISFDFRALPDPAKSLFILDEKYLYIRTLQAPNATNATNGSAPLSPQEAIFFINQDITPQLAKSTNLTQQQMNSWRRTFVSSATNNSINIFVQQAGGANQDQVIVNKLQVTAKQAQMNSKSDSGPGITATVINGEIKLCPPGCSDCSTGACTGCMSSFVFDSTTSKCNRCGPNCLSCSETNYTICSSCIVGSYLSNSSTCLPCDRSCATCTISPTNCTSCLPGRTFVNGTCSGCPRKCISCTNNTFCDTCNRGFVAVNGTCRGCGSSCSNCSASNIMECLSCAKGLTLVNSSCVSCPDKCQTCNNGICSTCIPGFTPNSAGLCVPSCQISCATCADNQPSTCLSCYAGATLNGTTCQLTLACNADSSCTDCGQGLGYVLAGSNCVQCSNISNCLQCDSTNTNLCSFCSNGYYINTSSLCSSCSDNCLQCISADLCSACAIGYTLPEGQTQGQCLQCQSPCATCLGVTTYCTSCMPGFTKKGWKCQNNTHVKFSFTLNDIPVNVLGNIDGLVLQILRACGENTTNVDAVTFDIVQSGSTLVGGSVTTTTTSPTVAASSLSSALATNSFGSYSVISSSVSAQGVQEDHKPKTGLIVGLAVGISLAVILVIVVSCVIYRRRKTETSVGSREGEIVIELSNQEPATGKPGQLIGVRQFSSQPANQYEMIQPSSEVKAWEKQMIDN